MKVRARRIWQVRIMHSLNIYRTLQILCVLMELIMRICLAYNIVFDNIDAILYSASGDMEKIRLFRDRRVAQSSRCYNIILTDRAFK